MSRSGNAAIRDATQTDTQTAVTDADVPVLAADQNGFRPASWSKNAGRASQTETIPATDKATVAARVVRLVTTQTNE
jgi:hypothetical protein